jgi:hypothetical protein
MIAHFVSVWFIYQNVGNAIDVPLPASAPVAEIFGDSIQYSSSSNSIISGVQTT